MHAGNSLMGNCRRAYMCSTHSPTQKGIQLLLDRTTAESPSRPGSPCCAASCKSGLSFSGFLQSAIFRRNGLMLSAFHFQKRPDKRLWYMQECAYSAYIRNSWQRYAMFPPYFSYSIDLNAISYFLLR